MTETDVVLRARGLSVEYAGPTPTRAVRNVSLELRRGEMLGIAGESGCGKSTLAYALTRLLRPPAELVEGTIEFSGKNAAKPIDLMQLDDHALRAFRWTKIAMVFQSAMNSLNPVARVGKQFSDIFTAHRPEMSKDQRNQRARELLNTVGIDPERVKSYAHELSGGMRQRVVIALALALNPEIVVMDEPTTALDVVVQREILEEVQRLRRELGFSVIFITHDLSLLLELSDRVAVMYAGEIVEFAPAMPIGLGPAHPYTRGLLQSFPELLGDRRELQGVPGYPPDLRDAIPGCAFEPRCGYSFAPCAGVHPVLEKLHVLYSPGDPLHGSADGRRVSCHLHRSDLHPKGPPPELSGVAGATDEASDATTT